MFGLYEEIKNNQGVETARSLVKTILANNNSNVSVSARILGTCRKTIRRARDGTLEDYSRAPITTNKSKTKSDLENLILSERKITKYGRVRLAKHLNLKYGIDFPSSTIGNIFKRNIIKKYNYTRKAGSPKPLYDYENIRPFGMLTSGY